MKCKNCRYHEQEKNMGGFVAGTCRVAYYLQNKAKWKYLMNKYTLKADDDECSFLKMMEDRFTPRDPESR